ncbi:glycoside hydrolase family 16 protein [uncultured Nocardioides sp.]|uniref:glycoside hydrolase family 16 protein n=1 Tax=uncultured Nocardioides sp. TaxID=198441 RepID=UPI0026240A85|nr:glycoside hydrolase family 16 protein [uncultured Nocardioides sp.]
MDPPRRVEDFGGGRLDRTVWVPHYLPAWSSAAATAAAFRLDGGRLDLEVPLDHPLWCPDRHAEPLRVSGLQSGSWSGPVGSSLGQQRFADGLTVREEQPRHEGWLPRSGEVSMRAEMHLSPRSMAALWLAGFEDDPGQRQCGEICVAEVFGRSVVGGPDHPAEPSAEVGVGIKPFRDPDLADDFAAVRLPLDVARPHDYAVDWDAGEAAFSVDGRVVRRCAAPPTYPMQLVLAVFDFPDWPGPDDHVPRMVVHEVTATV